VTGAASFGLAESAEDRRAALRLRYAVLRERGWIDPAEFADGLERDDYDERAAHLVARVDAEIVGTLRLVTDADDVERFLREAQLAVPAAGTAVVGRLTVARRQRERSRELTRGLYAETLRVLVAAGMQRAVSFAAENALRMLRLHGLRPAIPGARRVVDGVPRVPVVFDASVLAAFLGSLDTRDRDRYLAVLAEAG
jgi:predicted GNAT family N-acyltransferase